MDIPLGITVLTDSQRTYQQDRSWSAFPQLLPLWTKTHCSLSRC